MTATGHKPRQSPGPVATLRAAGVTELEERLYRHLLGAPTATLSELACAVQRGVVATRRALDSLEASGLVTRRGRPARYFPASPDLAVDALIMRRQEELERCRLAAAELLLQFRDGARELGDVIELLEGSAATEQRYSQLLGTARHEVLMFDKPPYLGPSDNLLEIDALRRGVAFRAVYAPESFEPAGRLDLVRRWQAAGEQARVGPEVPLKLMIVDGVVALLPLMPEEPVVERHTAIVVHRSSLLTTLAMLFDMLWDRAVPVMTDEAGSAAADPLGADGTILRLLGAGVKDQAIARQLGISLRTVRRRLAVLMSATGATSRFQLGAAAAQRGWL